MKARVNQTGILLSVGMIVKNEEENLPNCLDALQPLLEAIPSELIIVDTGSTDATRAIAAQYTDKVYDFEWSDDFAAARNETLKYAQGEWYMYLDADEWLESCDGIIEFFRDKDALAKYNCAAFNIRNYMDHEKTMSTQFHASRIARRFPEMEFRSRVHEQLLRHGPQKILDCVAIHYGYTQDDGKDMRKNERNLPILLKMIESGDLPDPSHTYFHVARVYANQDDWDKAEEYCRKGIAALTPDDIGMRCALYQYLALVMCEMERWDMVPEIVAEYFAGKHVEYATDVDMHLLLAQAYRGKGDRESALREFEAYFQKKLLAESGQFDPSDLGATMFLYPQKSQANCAYYIYAQMIWEKDPRAALEVLDKICGWEGVNKPDTFIRLVAKCVEAVADWGWYARRYHRIQGDEEWRNLWQQRIISTLEKFSESCQPMGQAFAEIGLPEDPFVLVVRQYKDPEAKLQLEKLLPVIPADIEAMLPLYCAMRARLDIEPLVSRLDWDDMSDAMKIVGTFDDAGEVIDRYYKTYPNPPSLRGKRWKCVLQEHILLGTPPECDAGRRAFQSYCESLRDITSALYGDPDEENLSIIPHGHRFGIFMGRAEKAHERGDIAEYVRLLKKAAEAYPIMAEPVKLRVDEIGRLVEEEHRKQEERELLYSQIKDKILALIRIGDLTNAAEILGQYEKINPKDEEVAFLYRQIQNPEQPS